MHPEDVDLFDYVEGDLPEGQRTQLEAHLGSCAQCAEQIARLQASRDALRQAQPLQLPKQTRDSILVNLPERPRATRRPSLSFRQLLAAVVPVAVVAAVVIGLVNISGTNNEEGAAVGVEESTPSAPMITDASGGGQAAEENDRASKSRLLFVGPPADVAAQLQAKGFEARAVGDQVEVRNATRAEIRRALQGRRDGSVRIVIVP